MISVGRAAAAARLAGLGAGESRNDELQPMCSDQGLVFGEQTATDVEAKMAHIVPGEASLVVLSVIDISSLADPLLSIVVSMVSLNI